MRRVARATTAASPKRPASWGHRLRALLVTALVLGTFGARIGELTLVRHAMCVHGDLVHAETRPAKPAVPARTAWARNTGVSVAPFDAAVAADHDHCDVRAARFDGAGATHATLPTVALLTFLVWPGRRRDAAAPVAVLQLAPKTPPPVV